MTSAEASEHKSLLERIIRLRVVVLALGESAQPPWWRTGFLNETGLRFLERLYPRSAFRAAVHAAGKAACEIHDQAIGRRGVFHLFRLPEALEAEVRAFASFSERVSGFANFLFISMYFERLFIFFSEEIKTRYIGFFRVEYPSKLNLILSEFSSRYLKYLIISG